MSEPSGSRSTDTRAPIPPHPAAGSRPGPAHAPQVSVVVASYNMARYLPQALRSALGQDWPDLEVILVDDGSTDDTPRVAGAIAGEDPRLRYIHQRNAGQAAAKNRGIRESRGEYVAFLDGDDYWAPDKLRLQVPLLSRSSEVGVVYARLRYVDQDGNESAVSDNELFRGRISAPLFVRNFISFGTCVVRRACFERLGGFDESLRMGVDYDLWLRLSTEYEFDYVDRPLLYYRKWPGQMSNDVRGRYMNGIRIMERFVREYPDAISGRAKREGWANTYVGLGFFVWETESRKAAMRMFTRALRHMPTYVPAWRALLTAVLH